MRHIRSHFTKSSIEGVGTPTKRPLDYYLKSEVKFQHFATSVFKWQICNVGNGCGLPLYVGPFPCLATSPSCYMGLTTGPFCYLGLSISPFCYLGLATGPFCYMAFTTSLFCYLGLLLAFIPATWALLPVFSATWAAFFYTWVVLGSHLVALT